MKWVGLLFVMVFGMVMPLQAANYTIHDLSGIGGISSQALGLNDRGQIVGRYYTSPSVYRAFVREVDGSIKTLANLAGATGSEAYAINNHGQIVGLQTINGRNHIVLWDSDGITDLGIGSVVGINDLGQVAGSSPYMDIFIWDKTTGQTNLGSGIIYSLNNNGQVLGMTNDPALFKHAFLWNPTDGFIDLGNRNAMCLNDAGIVASGDSIWRKGKGWTQYGPPPGSLINYSTSMNDLGQIVMSSWGGTGYRGLTWDPTNGFQDLYPAFTGKTTMASRINNDGVIISQFDGRSVLLQPVPEPSGLLCLAGGLFVIIRRKGR